MQTPKGRTNSFGASQRRSPQSTSSEVSNKNSLKAVEVSEKVSPRVVRKLKTGSRYSDPTASSSNQATRASKEGSPKVSDRKSPRSSISEEKRPGRVAELESQISQLENDLKTVKDQLCSSEASKKQALKDVEESNQQLLALSTKQEESQKSVSKEIHTVDQDHSLLSEFDTPQKKNSNGSAALASALDEITQLKIQLEKTAADSEATQANNSESELLKLKENLAENLLIVEEMKNELKLCKKSESHAKTEVVATLTQLETAKKMVESLRSDGSKATEAYDSVFAELHESRTRVNSLEELVQKLEVEIKNSQNDSQNELKSMNLEVKKLKSALEAAKIMYDEENARSSEEIKSALQMVDEMKSREVELEDELRKSKYLIEELNANLMDKEIELQGISEENQQLMIKLENNLSGQREHELEKELETLKADLVEKETPKLEITEMARGEMGNEILPDLEMARASEKEALMKLGYMTEEVDKSNRKAARVTTQLEAAQVVNADMEAELRRLKVQSNQWRKAAEAAAAMLSAGNNNGHVVERTGSMDSNYNPRTGRMSSPYGDEIEEDLMKKKNVLRRIEVLWKKPQK